MSTIVVGAGAIGTSIAMALARRGEPVTLVEHVAPASGTTSTSFAWVNANTNRDSDYHAIKVAGMGAHVRLADELDTGYVRSGGVQLVDAGSEAWVRANVERLLEAGYDARWITPRAALEIAGEIRIPDETTAVASFPDEGYVLPDRLTLAMLAEAARHGASLVLDEVVELHDDPRGASAVLASGTRIEADHVVLATGRWTAELAAKAGIDVPMLTETTPGSPTIGLLATARAPAPVTAVVHAPEINVRPAAGGHVVAQSLDLNADVGLAEGASAAVVRTLADRLATLLGTDVDPTQMRSVVGVRSLPADGHPIVGFAGDRRTYLAVAHGGITLGPLLGSLVADELLDGRRSPLLEPFSLARFDLGAATYRPPSRMGEQ